MLYQFIDYILERFNFCSDYLILSLYLDKITPTIIVIITMNNIM